MGGVLDLLWLHTWDFMTPIRQALEKKIALVHNADANGLLASI